MIYNDDADNDNESKLEPEPEPKINNKLRLLNLRLTISNIIMPIIGVCVFALIGYYIYYLYDIQALTTTPFMRYHELVFMYDYEYYKENPSEFVKSFVTVTHFWLFIASIITYFTVLTKFFNPFPLLSSSGIYIFMLDANKLHILKLKETYSRLFVWNKKTYFLPKETLRYGNSTILVYLSNINVAVNMLRINKEDIEMMIKTLVNYVYSYRAYINKISKQRVFYPRDILKRNYHIFVDMDNKTIDIQHTNEKGAYKVTRFVTADIFFVKGENTIKIDDANVTPTLVLGELEVPLLAQSIVYEGKQKQQKSLLAVTTATAAKKSTLAKIYSYIDYGMNITNPYLAYDILRNRKIILNLYKYFVGSFSSKILPLTLILLVIILLVLFFPQLQSMITPSTPTTPTPTTSVP
ncbi:MAG: hypothetical protein QXQ68_07405 [Candidatus Nitrosocaldaceae archaeon]